MQLNELFETNPQEFDTRLVTATERLKEAAAEHGVDLDVLSDEDKTAMLRELMGVDAPRAEETPESKVASEPVPPAVVETPSAEPTFLEVSIELTKRAAAESLDLTVLTPEQYEQVFTKVAADMLAERDPEVQETRAKIAEQEEHWARMGRIAAEAFDERLQKIAEEREAEEAKETKEEPENKFPPAAKGKDDDKDAEKTKEAMMGKLLGAAKAIGSKGDSALKGVGKGVDRAARAVGGHTGDLTYRQLGAGAVGAGALAAGGAAAAGRGKSAAAEHIEAEAVKVARQVLVDNGIDPDTGEKIASDETAAIANRAREILLAHGWELA